MRESAQFLAASRRRADDLARLRLTVLGQAHPVGHLKEPTRAHNSAPLPSLSTQYRVEDIKRRNERAPF